MADPHTMSPEVGLAISAGGGRSRLTLTGQEYVVNYYSIQIL